MKLRNPTDKEYGQVAVACIFFGYWLGGVVGAFVYGLGVGCMCVWAIMKYKNRNVA